MGAHIRPVVVVSKCLGFAACRYNGQTIPDDFVRALRPHVEFLPVCPEMEIGLGCPRDPVRVLRMDGKHRLVQPASGRDLTSEMAAFSARFLDVLGPTDGIILKSRSPTCGIKDTKVYSSPEKKIPVAKTAGFFGTAVLARLPGLAVEDEGCLKNFIIREHFLGKLFTLASFHAVCTERSINELVRFHSKNKLLLSTYSQKEARFMGRIVAGRKEASIDQTLVDYETHLFSAFAHPSRSTANINTLMHGMGFFSESLSRDEKAFFLDALNDYRQGKVPLSVPRHLLQSWVVRFGQEYLSGQSYFAPYPKELMEITDSGKGRDLRR